MVKRDYYADLGVSPASEDVVIHAAYRALMQRYHPDRNPSEEAAERVRSINAAYAVLRDQDLRARYDASRRVPEHVPLSPPLQRPPARSFGLAAGVILAGAIVSLYVLGVPAGDHARIDRLPASPSAARATNGTDPESLLPQLPSALPADFPEPPVLTLPEAEDLPEVQPQPVPLPVVHRGRAAGETYVTPAPAPEVRPQPRPQARSQAKPAPEPRVDASFDCRFASGRGESTVCKSANLATLDRHLALLYSQSWGQADAQRRTQLLGTREAFLARREACRTESCVSGAYVERMREVSDIMARRTQP